MITNPRCKACALLFGGIAVIGADLELPLQPLEIISTTSLETGFPFGNQLITTPSGGFLLTTAGSGGDSVTRLNPQGVREWGTRIDGVDAQASIALPNGDFLVTGAASTQSATPVNYLSTLVWLGPDGTVKRQKIVGGGAVVRHSDSVCTCDVTYNVVPTPDGGFLLTGASSLGQGEGKLSPAHGSLDGWIAKVDSQGERLWDQSFGTSGYDLLSRALPLPDGGFLLAGTAVSGQLLIWLIRIDSKGTVVWERTATAARPNQSVFFAEVVQSSNGDLITVGTQGGSPSGTSGLVIRFRSDGTELWRRVLETSKYDYLSSVAELSDGRMVVGAGFSRSDKARATVIACLGLDGEVLWEKKFPGTGSNHAYRATKVIAMPEGKFAWATPGDGSNTSFGILAPESIPASGDQLRMIPLPEYSRSQPSGYFSINGPSHTRFVVEQSVDLQSWSPVVTNVIESFDVKFSPDRSTAPPTHSFEPRSSLTNRGSVPTRKGNVNGCISANDGSFAQILNR